MDTTATIMTTDDPPSIVLVAKIMHSFKAGAHVYTSDDIPGLIVFSQSQDQAIRQLTPVIRKLVKANLGYDCDVKLGAPISGTQLDYAVITKKEEKAAA
jgi:hypothetical protein